MPRSQDPTAAIRKKAESFPDVTVGTSCNQSSYKVGKTAFLYIGPGAKGIGYKAMFKLNHAIEQAREFASEAPDRFEVGSTGWVTARFTDEQPLLKSIWGVWLRESYEIAQERKPVKAAKKIKLASKQRTTKKTKATRKRSTKKLR